MIRKLGTHLSIDLTRCKVIPLSLMTSQVRLDVCLYIVKSQASTDAPWLFYVGWRGKGNI